MRQGSFQQNQSSKRLNRFDKTVAFHKAHKFTIQISAWNGIKSKCIVVIQLINRYETVPATYIRLLCSV